ncbi:MAG: Gfo/Idh/MocA family oxidoreductase [Bacteroidales bacterium]|nr:Gfo/Idh/MocA family oxidoreductase [Bacteroidales bacterium]
MKTYHWGILGLGSIAHKFATALAATERGKLISVGSRSAEKAKSFGEQYGAESFYGNYEQLIKDENVEIIYIATPHPLHYEYTRKCLEAGKHVLCEKPITINSAQFEELKDLAASKKLFYMDALWTRFLPHIEKMLEYIQNKRLGEIIAISADFGIKPPRNPVGRLFNPELGGGSILDIGIYPIFLSLLILGYPDEISVSSLIGDTGVDETCGILFRYNSGAIASLFSTFLANTKTAAEIAGTEGRIELHRKFFAPTSLTFIPESGEKEVYSFSIKSNGYEFEAEEVMRCLDDGMTESPRLSLKFTSELMRLLDEVRMKAGMLYKEDQNI